MYREMQTIQGLQSATFIHVKLSGVEFIFTVLNYLVFIHVHSFWCCRCSCLVSVYQHHLKTSTKKEKREKACHESRDLLDTLTATAEIYKMSHQMAHLTLTPMHGLLWTPVTTTRTHFPLYLLPHSPLSLPTIRHACCQSIKLKPSWLNKTKMFEVNQLSWSVTKNSISTEMYTGKNTEQPHITKTEGEMP